MTGAHTASPILVWFRNDLRLADNPALAAAVKDGRPIIPVFTWAPEEEGDWQPGAASNWWLDSSLRALSQSLEGRGSRLVIRRGPSAAVLPELAEETKASAVFWNRLYRPATIQRDSELKSALRKRGINADSFSGSLLFEPGTIVNNSGRPFAVFTPFWRACLLKAVAAPLPDAPRRLPAPQSWPDSLRVAELQTIQQTKSFVKSSRERHTH